MWLGCRSHLQSALVCICWIADRQSSLCYKGYILRSALLLTKATKISQKLERERDERHPFQTLSGEVFVCQSLSSFVCHYVINFNEYITTCWGSQAYWKTPYIESLKLCILHLFFLLEKRGGVGVGWGWMNGNKTIRFFLFFWKLKCP